MRFEWKTKTLIFYHFGCANGEIAKDETSIRSFEVKQAPVYMYRFHPPPVPYPENHTGRYVSLSCAARAILRARLIISTLDDGTREMQAL